MASGRYISEKFRRVLLGWLLIAALAGHGLIPVGYMPDFARVEHGKGPALMLCDGMDMMPMAMAGHHHENSSPEKKEKDEKTQDHATCPFSINSVFAFDDGQAALSAPVYIFVSFLLLAAFAFAPSRRFGNASARSPPVFS